MRKLVARFSPLARAGAPCPRSSHGVSALNSRVYVIGGEAVARVPIDMTVHELHAPERGSSSWRQIAPARAPQPRIAHAQAVVDGRVLVFGGRQGEAMGEAALDDLWAFDPEAEAWEELAAPSAPGGVAAPRPCPRSFHAATAAPGDHRLFVFGGCGESGRLADLWEFDLRARAWRRLPDPPSDVRGRGGATLEAAGGALWLAGGFAGEETSDVLRFDRAAETWTRRADASEWLRPRSVCSSFAADDAVILFGGEVDPSEKGHLGAGGFADDLVALDAATGEPLAVVVASAEQPAARGWAGAAAVETSEQHAGRAVLFGGLSGDDDAPERLGDAWEGGVARDAAGFAFHV